MEENIIFKFFENLPRQGPGDDEHTKKAFLSISEVPNGAKILDIGCGRGMQTIELARLCKNCKITALDIYQPYLDSLNKRAESGGFADRIKTVCASMDEIPFPPESFDIIWAEGSIFIIGFEKGINYWKKFLKSGGWMVISDAGWFTKNPSKEAEEFWNDCYPEPGIKTEDEYKAVIEDAGLFVADSFRLPENVWYESYYDYMKKNNDYMKEKYENRSDISEMIEQTSWEMETFRNHSDEYGYTYFIIKKP